MLSDPTITTAYFNGLPTFPVGGNATFRKIANGKLIAVDSPFSADQPAFISVRQRTRKYGTVKQTPSDYTVRYEQHFNVAAVAGVLQDDIPLIVEVRVLSYPQIHTETNILMAQNVAMKFAYDNLARLRAGEGI